MCLVRLARVIPLVRTVTMTASVAALKVGDILRSHQRRFTGEDVAVYAGVSGDHNPVHLDDAFARRTSGFQRGRVVHGMLAAALFPTLIASRFPGAVYVSQSLKFVAPVYIEDVVVAQVQALHIKATGASHIVKFATKCFTSDEETLAIDGEAMAFLPTLQPITEAIG